MKIKKTKFIIVCIAFLCLVFAMPALADDYEDMTNEEREETLEELEEKAEKYKKANANSREEATRKVFV